MNAQAYVKFVEQPSMQLKPSKNYYYYKIAYKALKKSTIYLELKRGNELVGSGVYLINESGAKTVKMSIKTVQNLEDIKFGGNYSYNLYMYEGGRNDWSNKACETKVLNGVTMNRIKPSTRPSLINTFN